MRRRSRSPAFRYRVSAKGVRIGAGQRPQGHVKPPSSEGAARHCKEILRRCSLVACLLRRVNRRRTARCRSPLRGTAEGIKVPLTCGDLRPPPLSLPGLKAEVSRGDRDELRPSFGAEVASSLIAGRLLLQAAQQTGSAAAWADVLAFPDFWSLRHEVGGHSVRNMTDEEIGMSIVEDMIFVAAAIARGAAAVYPKGQPSAISARRSNSLIGSRLRWIGLSPMDWSCGMSTGLVALALIVLGRHRVTVAFFWWIGMMQRTGSMRSKRAVASLSWLM
jgi:hypothetical protein